MNQTGKTIQFYRATGKYGFLSNLYPCEVVIERRFSSAEHAYQYAKPMEQKVRDWIAIAPYPRLAAQIAHNLSSYDILANWNDIKVARMRLVLRTKFDQHYGLRLRLLDLSDAVLMEASKTDAFWGIGKNGKGQNTLGMLLMELRDELKKEANEG